MIEQAVGDSLSAFQDSELAAALRSLKDMVSSIGDTPNSTEFVGPYGPSDMEHIQPPSKEEVDELLHKAEGKLAVRRAASINSDILHCQTA